MPRTAVPIEIFPRAKSLMRKMLAKRQLEGHYSQRIHIILMSYEQRDNNQIAKALTCDRHTVSKWRQRWQHYYEELTAYEQGTTGSGVTAKELMEKIKEILTDSPRQGSPSRLSEVAVNRLVALACESPQKYGLPFTHWSYQTLSQQAHKMGIEVSPVHVGRLLKKRLTSTQK